MPFFNKKLFWLTLLSILIIETFSLAAYHFDSVVLQTTGFFIVFLGVLVLSLRNIEYGVLIAFIELFISSFGHLFKLDLGPIQMTMRVGIFISVQIAYNIMLITHFLRGWTKNRFFTRLHAFFQKGLRDSVILTSFFRSPYFYPNVLLVIALITGVTVAIVNGHSARDILRDADAYVVFAYFPIIWAAMAQRASRLRLYNVFLASLVWLGAQTALVLFVFAHRLQMPMQALYFWIRDARIGEIALVSADFYRIFFQSYIYALIAIFIFAVFFIFKKSTHYKLQTTRYIFWLFVLAAFLLLVSFSRSFWFGGTVAGIVFAASLLYFYRVGRGFTPRHIWPAFLKMLAGAVVALAIIFTLVNFPYPPKGPPILLADLFGGRALSLFDEPAADSRWRLLPVLWEEVKKSPVLGAGFGKLVTYQTTDPRILAQDPTGMRTTYAFEWGYLDMWLKLGLLGLLAYGWLVGRILRNGWRKLRQGLTPISFGLWLGLIALVAAHFFTPYLNHPLGIGIIIAAASIFRGSTSRGG